MSPSRPNIASTNEKLWQEKQCGTGRHAAPQLPRVYPCMYTPPHGPPTRSTAAASGGHDACTHAHTPVAYHAPTGL